MAGSAGGEVSPFSVADFVLFAGFFVIVDAPSLPSVPFSGREITPSTIDNRREYGARPGQPRLGRYEDMLRCASNGVTDGSHWY